MTQKMIRRTRGAALILAGALISMVSMIPMTSLAQDGPASKLPTFDRVVFLEETSETSANVSIGDLNGDGRLDIVLAKGRHWPLVNRVLFGDGRGGFPLAADLGEASDRTYSCRLTDIDADGDLDVVVSNDRPDPKRIYVNDGRGRFVLGSTFGAGAWRTRNASVADLNGDGFPDVIAANRTGDRPGGNYICQNDGRGKFDESCVEFSQESATTITTADFNGDGFIDLAVPHRDGGQSHVYLNGESPDWSGLRRIAFGPPDATVRMAEAGDLDGDGRMDIVTIDQRRGVSAYFGSRDEGFSPALAIGIGDAAPYALTLADLNQDGKLDVIVGHVEAPATAHFNLGTGKTFAPVHFGDGAGTVYGFAVGDLDADGHVDIAAARSGAPNVLYLAVAP